MWKRFQGNHRQRDTIIGAPTLLHTTFDESKLVAIPNVSEVRHGLVTPVTTPDSTRKIDRSELTGLPLLPFQTSEATPTQPTRPLSDILTASSIYSQQTPELRQESPPLPNFSMASSVYSEVSPPSSPDNYAAPRFDGRSRSPSVSPIEKKYEPFEQRKEGPSKFTSHIPVLRRGTGDARRDAPTGLGIEDSKPTRPVFDRVSTATKWGDFLRDSKADPSRTPTDDTTRKPNLFEESTEERPFGTSVTITGGRETPDSFKSPKTGRRPFGLGFGLNANPSESRASPTARQAKPQSMDKKLPAAPFGHFSSASSEALKLQGGPLSSSPTPYSTGQTAPVVRKAVSPRIGERDEDEIRPIVPLKAGRNSPPHSRSTSSGLHQILPTQSTTANPSAATDSPALPSSSIEHEIRSTLMSLNLEDQPPSRFSFSTYATETTTHESGPNTPDMRSTEVFSTPAAAPVSAPAPTPTSTPATSILNRPRPPIGTPESDAKSIKRKPAPSHHHTSSSTSTINASLSKRLPQSPPEAGPVDLIASLQSQLNVLSLRRSALNRVIRDLTEGLPRNQSSVRAREEVKKRVDECKDQLAEVQQEEHVIGLRLHRAWKRNDSHNTYEPTGLWVRRVTGTE
ncbi:MAG: hypothetical protein M4579_000620 [Chaenotheca gracillima]|nr:MAG: hypothetical protein M4579_000620 [Chaenotheca gracillima]